MLVKKTDLKGTDEEVTKKMPNCSGIFFSVLYKKDSSFS